MKKTMTIIGILTAILLLVSCANVEMPKEEISEQPTQSQIMEEILSRLPTPESEDVQEFQGETLVILTPETETVLGDEQAAGSIRGALKKRNEILADAYEIEVTARAVAEDEIAELLIANVQAGVSTGDLLCYSAETTAMLWSQSLLTDMKELPYFNASQVCADLTAATVLEMNGALYMIDDPSAQNSEDMYVMFYDRTLVKEAGLPLPEKDALAGNWTLAMFQSYSEAVAEAVMNKESHDLQTDVFGYSSANNTDLLPYLLWCTQGNRSFVKQEGGIAFAYTIEQIDERLTPLRAVYDSVSRYPLDGEDARNAFLAGRLGFYVDRLDYLKELYAHSARDYGILPLPKASEEAAYISPIDESGNVLSVPGMVKSRSKVGLGLTAICAAGGKLMRAAEKETYVTLYSLDNDQSCMLETLLDTGRFDFGGVYGCLNEDMEALGRGLLTDVLAKDSRITTTVEKHLEKFVEYAAENLH